MNKLKHFFVCDNCRETCSNGEDEVGKFGPDNCYIEYHPRKQKIKCLGELCDIPCHLQTEECYVTKEQLVQLILYITSRLNEFLIEDKNERS